MGNISAVITIIFVLYRYDPKQKCFCYTALRTLGIEQSFWSFTVTKKIILADASIIIVFKAYQNQWVQPGPLYLAGVTLL